MTTNTDFPRYSSPDKKYAFVGPNYQQYGEQPGYVYYPYTDRYYVDPNAVKSQYQQQGLIKKDPTLMQQITPIAATTLAVQGAKYAGTQLPGLLGIGAPSAAAPAAGAAAGAGAGAGAGSIASGVGGGGGSGTAFGGGAELTGAGGATDGIGTSLLGGGSGMLGVGALPLAGIAGATYLGGKSALDMLRGKKDNSLQGKIGRVSLGIATGGLSELARPFLSHTSTREVAQNHTKDLLGMGQNDPAWQSYVQGMRAPYNSAPPDPSKPFAGGKYGSWDEYKKAGLDAGDLTGVYGNLKTFGPDWAKLSLDDRKKVTQGLIDANLYNSKKGEVVITDPTKALQIKDQILSGQQPAQPQAQPQPQPQPVANAQNPVGAPPKKGLLGLI